MIQWARPFANILIGGDSDTTLWPAVIDLCVNATSVPDLFRAVVENDQLWNRSYSLSAPQPANLRCKLVQYRLVSLLKSILVLRQESERMNGEAPVRPDEDFRNPDEERRQAVCCFNALMGVLAGNNAAHLLEDALRPDCPGGPVDAALLRRFQTDTGMHFPFLALDSIPLRILFSNSLWAAYSNVDGILLDRSRAAQIMTVFGRSIANPVLDQRTLFRVLDRLVEIVNRAPSLATAVLTQLGEYLPAGNDASGNLVPIETWLEFSIVPGLNRVVKLVVDLYPQEERGHFDLFLHLVERRVADSDGASAAVREAVSAFTYNVLLFDAPGLSCGDTKMSLGPDVDRLIDVILSRECSALCKTDATTRREPAAGNQLVRNLDTLSNVMQMMSFFRRNSIVEIVRSKVRTLRGAALVLRAVSNVEWTPTDIRDTCDAIADWSASDLIKLGFLEQLGGPTGPVDISRDALITAALGDKDGVITVAADVVKAALPGDDGEKLEIAEHALLAHAQHHVAQALALHCLAGIDAGMQRAAGNVVSLQGELCRRDIATRFNSHHTALMHAHPTCRGVRVFSSLSGTEP